MLCQHCKKKPATVNFVETINGDSFELHLCDACYAYKYGEFEAQAANAFLNGLFGNAAPAAKKCGVCGMSFGEYEKTGLLGCASCYDVFKEELLPYIEQIQRNVEHIGRVGTHSDEHDLRLKLKSLQEQLENALQRNDYVLAGKLNSQMQIIKKKLKGGRGDV